jgi:hypothetical protein
MKVILVFALVVVFASSAWTTQPSFAQEKFKSGISGRVTDLQGAVVFDAWIRVIRRSTKKVVHEVKTNESGEYAVDVEADVYEVEAEAVGFKKAKRKYIPVSSEARNLVDFVLVPAEN